MSSKFCKTPSNHFYVRFSTQTEADLNQCLFPENNLYPWVLQSQIQSPAQLLVGAEEVEGTSKTLV